MACYSNECKFCCGKVVMVVSTIIFLMGLLTAVFGVMQMGAIPAADKALAALPDMSSFALGIIILGLICILIGLLGCLSAKKRNPCFACLFIILSGLLGLILLIIGFIMVGGAGLLKPAIINICNAPEIKKYGQQYNSNINSVMCTAKCPCNKFKGSASRYTGGTWVDGTGVDNF
jgi:hypothetical protein